MFDKYSKINKVAIETGLNISFLKSWQTFKSNLKHCTFTSFTSFSSQWIFSYFLLMYLKVFIAHVQRAKNCSRHRRHTLKGTKNSRPSRVLHFSGGWVSAGFVLRALTEFTGTCYFI